MRLKNLVTGLSCKIGEMSPTKGLDHWAKQYRENITERNGRLMRLKARALGKLLFHLSSIALAVIAWISFVAYFILKAMSILGYK